MRIPPEKIRIWVERNFECKFRKNGLELRINNPFNGDLGFHLEINPEKGVAHDWRGDDDWAGPINSRTGKRDHSFLRFVRKYLGCSYTQALEAVLGADADLSAYLRLPARPDPQESEESTSLALPEGSEPLVIAEGTLATMLRNWLHKRGLSDEMIGVHDLHFLGPEVIWPYYEFGELVYWQARSRLNKQFRFPDANVGVTKSEFLYGFDQVEQASYLIITEAIFDCHTLGTQCLASGGATLVKPQLNKLRFLGPKHGIILAPDNDVAGLKSVLANAALLKGAGFRVFYSIPPEYDYTIGDQRRVTKDWNEIGRWAVGFDKVRTVMDENVRLLTDKEAIELRRRINSSRSQ